MQGDSGGEVERPRAFGRTEVNEADFRLAPLGKYLQTARCLVERQLVCYPLSIRGAVPALVQSAPVRSHCSFGLPAVADSASDRRCAVARWTGYPDWRSTIASGACLPIILTCSEAQRACFRYLSHAVAIGTSFATSPLTVAAKPRTATCWTNHCLDLLPVDILSIHRPFHTPPIGITKGKYTGQCCGFSPGCALAGGKRYSFFVRY